VRARATPLRGVQSVQCKAPRASARPVPDALHLSDSAHAPSDERNNITTTTKKRLGLAHVLVRRGTSDSDGDGRTGPPGRVGTSEAHASPRLLCDAFRLGATRATQVALGRWFIITRLFL
jgi:hypothetical protein